MQSNLILQNWDAVIDQASKDNPENIEINDQAVKIHSLVKIREEERPALI